MKITLTFHGRQHAEGGSVQLQLIQAQNLNSLIIIHDKINHIIAAAETVDNLKCRRVKIDFS